jgi:hypothetical protein
LIKVGQKCNKHESRGPVDFMATPRTPLKEVSQNHPLWISSKYKPPGSMLSYRKISDLIVRHLT